MAALFALQYIHGISILAARQRGGTMKQNSKKCAALLVAAVMIGLASGGIIAYRKLNSPQPPNTQKTQDNTANSSKSPAKKLIKLTDSVSVKPAAGDYTADDHIWRLVNKTHPLNNSKYRPKNLQLATVNSRPDKPEEERSVRADIMPEVEQLFASAKAAGHDLQIGSGFRGYELQNTYYSSYVNAYGQAAADKFSSKPGYSEHQTGLVMDIAAADHNCYLETCFGETAAGKWLAKHAHEYGFILRYPKGKERITGYQYEPWHFRYVGRELAAALKKADMTLDQASPILLGKSSAEKSR